MTSEKTYDVLCIGNAIVDIIARCEESFLVDNAIIKGAMNLIDADRAELLYSRMGPAIEASGGSAGNTAAGVASFGGRAAFFGKVAKDALGEIYAHDIRAQGVAFDTKPLDAPPPTARAGSRSARAGRRCCPRSRYRPRRPHHRAIGRVRADVPASCARM